MTVNPSMGLLRDVMTVGMTIAVLWASCLGLAGCAAPLAEGGAVKDPAGSAGAAVDIRRFGQPADSLIQSGGAAEPLLFEIRDEEGWRVLWQRLAAGHSPTPPQPAVNFDREMLLGAFMGQRSSGGYTIEIVSVRDLGASLHITVVRTSPGPECMRLSVLTAPADVVRVDRVEKPVRWETRDRVRPCFRFGSPGTMLAHQLYPARSKFAPGD